MSHYKHLSITERENLYLLKAQGLSIRKIAAELHRSPSTISRELRRGKRPRHAYRPSVAQARYRTRRKRCGRKRILADPHLQAKIRFLIEACQWSPEEISNRLREEGNAFQISYTTIYRAIHAGLFDPPGRGGYVRKQHQFCSKLREKGKKRKKNSDKRSSRFPEAPHISLRPQEANERLCFGHWEADTVAGKRGSACLLTLTDRRSRFLLAAKVGRCTSEAVSDKMVELLSAMPPEFVASITPDRGCEFAKYEEISARLNGVPFYFPDPYSPWERGTNENTNGLLREYFPKYTDITPVSDDYVAACVMRLNLRPRKCLNWRSPFEVLFDEVLHLT